MADVRIFTYLPNPRLWKSTIAARLADVEVEIIGAKPNELAGWLWDFDARPLEQVAEVDKAAAERSARTGFSGKLYKSDAFLRAHPFGTVPAAFSGDGRVGIFESNSIMRCVARLAKNGFPIYGADPFEASRIDSYLDTSLVFARDSQIYLLSLGDALTADIHARASAAFDTWMSGIEAGLTDRDYLVGDDVTLADICFVCELTLFSRDRLAKRRLADLALEPITDLTRYPLAAAHYARLCAHEAFAPDMAAYLDKIEAQLAGA